MNSKDDHVPEVPLFKENEIYAELAQGKGTSLFLGRYSLPEVFTTMGKRNFFREAKKRKLWPLSFDLDSSEYPLQRLRIFYLEKDPRNLIVDLKIKEGNFRPPAKIEWKFSTADFHFLILEWLTLQNPLLHFSGKWSPLPGQAYPGLNLKKKVLDIFIYLARLMKKDGILAFPAYFHNALLFSRYFYFLNPEKAGEVLAIKESCSRVPFRQLAWIVFDNCLRDKEARVYEWKAEEMIYPLHRELKDYFESKNYKKRLRQTQKRLYFSIDWECFQKKAHFFALKE